MRLAKWLLAIGCLFGALPPASHVDAADAYIGLVGDESGRPAGGVAVLSVSGGGPAAAAGILPGDVITAIRGKAIRSVEAMDEALSGLKPGDRIEVHLERNGQPQTVQLVVGAKTPPLPLAPDSAETPQAAAQPPPLPDTELLPPPPPDAPVGPATLGVTVTGFASDTRFRFRLPVRSGAVVTAVRAGSPAEQAGIPVGAVIVGFGGLRIDSPAALVQAVRSARVGQEVELAYHVGNRTLRTKARLAAATEPTAPLARGEPDAAAGQLPPVEAFPLPPLPLQPPTPAQPPVLDRMGRMIEGLMGPREAPAPAAEAGEVIQLRQQVEALQSEIAALKQQVAELNARLKAVEKSPE